MYVPPIKNNKNTAIKITVLTQPMVTNILNNGIKILNTRIDESQNPEHNPVLKMFWLWT